MDQRTARAKIERDEYYKALLEEQIAHANTQAELAAARQRIAELEGWVNDYAGVRDQANWQSEQDAQAVWERDQRITELEGRVNEAKELFDRVLTVADCNWRTDKIRKDIINYWLTPNPAQPSEPE